MTEHTVTMAFDHLSDADAARAVLESSIRGAEVAIKPELERSQDHGVDVAAATVHGWELSAVVPEGMAPTAETLLRQTSGATPHS